MTLQEHRTDFFVVGVVKGGTTSLYDYLNQHPQIYLPPIKEINHFSQSDIDEADFLPEYALDVKIDLQKYLNRGMPYMVHIAHVNSKEDYLKLYRPAETEQLKGDISNSYMVCPHAAQQIFEHNPEARILVVLRNPIKRAWSQYLMNLREAKTNSENFVDEIVSDSKLAKVGWGVNHQYLELGKYCQQLNRYYALFPKEQIYPILFEEYTRDPQTTLSSICEFLNISSEFLFDTDAKKNTASLPRNKSINEFLVKSGAIKVAKGLVPKELRKHLSRILYSAKALPEISAGESEFLRDFYREEVNCLQDLIGRDIYQVWNEFKTESK